MRQYQSVYQSVSVSESDGQCVSVSVIVSVSQSYQHTDRWTDRHEWVALKTGKAISETFSDEGLCSAVSRLLT